MSNVWREIPILNIKKDKVVLMLVYCPHTSVQAPHTAGTSATPAFSPGGDEEFDLNVKDNIETINCHALQSRPQWTWSSGDVGVDSTSWSPSTLLRQCACTQSSGLLYYIFKRRFYIMFYMNSITLVVLQADGHHLQGTWSLFLRVRDLHLNSSLEQVPSS